MLQKGVPVPRFTLRAGALGHNPDHGLWAYPKVPLGR